MFTLSVKMKRSPLLRFSLQKRYYTNFYRSTNVVVKCKRQLFFPSVSIEISIDLAWVKCKRQLFFPSVSIEISIDLPVWW